LGFFYKIANRPSDAEESFNSALALYGADDTESLNQVLPILGWTYEDGKYDQAETIYQRAIKLDEDTHNDAQLVLVLTGFGETYRRANRLTDAEPILIRGMNVAEHLAKPMNREWFGAAITMAVVYEQSDLPSRRHFRRRAIRCQFARPEFTGGQVNCTVEVSRTTDGSYAV
jgi:tetratricopeptide (TPR) repeat protein